MDKKRVRTLKGMTIAENLIAFVLVLTALTIAGSGFYIAGGLINRGKMYSDASDKAQVLMESGIYDEVLSAFRENASADSNNTYNSSVMISRMASLGYTYHSSIGYYVDESTMVMIRPFSYSDGDLTKGDGDKRCVAAQEKMYDFKSSALSDVDGNLKKLKGTYLCICVPIDPESIEQMAKSEGMTKDQAIAIADYVPIIYYIGEWDFR